MISIFGPPGSGKSIQTEKLHRKYGFNTISSRDLYVSMDDKNITLALNHGMPIDNEKSILALELVINTIHDSPKFPTILDDFPSTISQILWLKEQKQLEKLTGALILRVPRGELWMRLQKRGRIDDTRASIERRQETYQRTITAITHILKENNIKIAEIDGSGSEDIVLERVEEKLGEWDIIPKKTYENIERKSKFN